MLISLATIRHGGSNGSGKENDKRYNFGGDELGNQVEVAQSFGGSVGGFREKTAHKIGFFQVSMTL